MNVTATLFGQMLTFAILVWFIKAVLWEPMLKMLDERRKRIADGLAAAESGHREKQTAEDRAKEIIQDAKGQAAEIIGNAQTRAGEIVEGAKDDARKESERLLAASKAQMDQEVNQAKDGLRKQVVALAIEGAEKVLMHEVNAAEHNKALEKLAARL
ncbi:MAG: F0F1 ATP synthase subunit B [Gammaproteobacteria bacterium]|nr:F0F1 ATP synthase subunit B [Gammaproteobacteria bacterium]MDJ0870198.1 F0F1 ATP synthase subunit B [Gammaproteobacteria bacterium]MDJ0890042.1 F0F1 ATP synthase subunit B [Gammaproteobacteria bacterium]